MNQVIGQAGPALDLARATLGGARNGAARADADVNGGTPAPPAL
jgi:hypothetical protein